MHDANNSIPTPDLVLHSGKIRWTSRKAGKVTVHSCEAMAIRDGQVLALGSDERILPLVKDETDTVALAGRTVLPGMIETHIHLAMFGLSLLELDCRPSATGTIAEISSAVAASVAKKTPGDWIVGWGWDESRIHDGRGPTRFDLDQVAPKNPVILRRTCGHMAVANTAALRAAGISEDAADPEGGRLVRNAEGSLTGLVQEKALNLIQPPTNGPDELESALKRAQQVFLSRGITTIHDMATQAEHLRALSRLRALGGVSMRIRPWLWALDGNGFTGMLDSAFGAGVTSGFGDDWIRIQGMKFMLDGSVGGRAAAVKDTYADTEQYGILISDANDAYPDVRRALEHGLRVAIHGIGDRAVDAAVSVLKRAAVQFEDVKSMRNRIEHCALPSSSNLTDMASHGIIAASSVGFLYELGDSYLQALGPERMPQTYPQRSFANHGIIAPMNSDCPVTDANPWNIIFAAVTRTTATGQILDDEQNLSVAEAVHSMTADAAYASFEEETLGTFRPGAHADFAILDADPFEVSFPDLQGITADQTYVQGSLVFDRNTNSME